MHVSTENMTKHVLCGQDSDEGVVWGPLDHMTQVLCEGHGVAQWPLLREEKTP